MRRSGATVNWANQLWVSEYLQGMAEIDRRAVTEIPGLFIAWQAGARRVGRSIRRGCSRC
jgi:hypothetical protein